MAVGEFPFPDMPPVPGVTLSAVPAGIKPNRDDVVLIELAEGSQCAGVFTQNAFCAAPVTVCREHLANTRHSRYWLINAGNANACTGEQGLADARRSCEQVALLAGVSIEQVLPFSTGVIGEPLPMDKLLPAIEPAHQALAVDHWSAAAKGIMTTDTRMKGASISYQADGDTIVVNGIGKGSGMIKPNMATMLAYVTTNAACDGAMLQKIVKQAADVSFNRITVDGDTSTNDSCMLAATGQTTAAIIESENSTHYQALLNAVCQVMQQLAQATVADGEGATKLITVDVSGGNDQNECLAVAYAVAQSPLIKTAFFAADPNWGRIVAAIGYAGIKNLDDRAVTVHLDDVLIVKDGGRAASYTEEQGQAVMDQECLTIAIDLGRGTYQETVWTTDLSHEYIRINAEYRS